MKKNCHDRLLKAGAALLLSAFAAFPAYAAASGTLDNVTEHSITGTAADADTPSAPVDIELTISGGNGPGEAAVVTVKTAPDKGGSFSCPINWDNYEGSQFLVTAEAVTGDAHTSLTGFYLYNKETKTAVRKELPGSAKKSPEAVPVKIVKDGPKKSDASGNSPANAETGIQGDYLGEYKVSGYCNCEQCSGGHNLTYSGTVPQAGHTLAADLDCYPLGTKLMIDGTVYTVEDMGSGVNGNHLDIYFATHEEAVAYGLKNVNVYAVEPAENR